MTVKMTKDGKSADVHPDEVSNYTLYGWEAEKVAKKAKKAVKTKESDVIYDIYKVIDGKKSTSVSKANLSKADAEAWIKGRDADYELVLS